MGERVPQNRRIGLPEPEGICFGRDLHAILFQGEEKKFSTREGMLGKRGRKKKQRSYSMSHGRKSFIVSRGPIVLVGFGCTFGVGFIFLQGDIVVLKTGVHSKITNYIKSK